MAVPSSPVPAAAASQKKKKTTNNEDVEQKMETQIDENQKQRKRSKAPGIRVVGGRIYDPQNGKTCHQVKN